MNDTNHIAVEVSGLSKTFGPVVAVDAVDLTIDSGTYFVFRPRATKVATFDRKVVLSDLYSFPFHVRCRIMSVSDAGRYSGRAFSKLLDDHGPRPLLSCTFAIVQSCE